MQRTRVRDAAISFSSELMRSLDLNHIMRVAIDSLAFMAEVNAGGICLIEEGKWVGKIGYGEYSDEMIQRMNIDYDNFWSGVLASENLESLVFEDAANDPRANQENIELLGVKSAIVVPLIVGKQTIGVAWLTQTDRLRTFTEDQVKFCTVMGSQAAIAISNAQAHQKEIEQVRRDRAWVDSLSGIADEFARSQDIRLICQRALEAVSEHTGCRTSAVFYLDRDNHRLVKFASIGRSAGGMDGPDEHSMENDKVFAVKAVKTRAMIMYDGDPAAYLPDDQRKIYDEMGMEDDRKQRMLYMPMMSNDEAVGVLCYAFPMDRPHSTIDLDILRTLAAQLALAIQNWEMSQATAREDSSKTEPGERQGVMPA